MKRSASIAFVSILLFGCSHGSTSVMSSPRTHLSPVVGPSTNQPPWQGLGVGSVAQIADGRDGNVWFFTTQGQYGRIQTDGNFISDPFPDPSQQGLTIASNPDGNIYIDTTNSVSCHLYRVHPDMTVVDLGNIFQCSGADHMVSGYDKRLWIVDGTSVITRVTTSGVASTLTMPQPVGGFVVRGSSVSRAMFTANYANGTGTVYRIALDDSITSLTLALDSLMSVSGDGYLWGEAGDYFDRQIVRIDDSLNPTYFKFTSKTAIVETPVSHNGVLYMPSDVNPGAGNLYRFDMKTGTRLTKWALPNTDTTDGIIGPDGRLWIVDNGLVYADTL